MFYACEQNYCTKNYQKQCKLQTKLVLLPNQCRIFRKSDKRHFDGICMRF